MFILVSIDKRPISRGFSLNNRNMTVAKTDGLEEDGGASVVACSDIPQALEPSRHNLDAVATLVFPRMLRPRMLGLISFPSGHP